MFRSIQRRLDDRRLQERAMATIRATYDWYVEDPKRWVSGSWFGIRPEAASYDAHGNLIAVKDGEELPNLGLVSSTGDGKYDAEVGWEGIYQHQQKNTLTTCVMGGMEKFAWEAIGRPDMKKAYNRLRVAEIAEEAAFISIHADYLSRGSEYYPKDPQAGREYLIREEGGQRPATSRMVSANDGTGFYRVIEILETALGIPKEDSQLSALRHREPQPVGVGDDDYDDEPW